MDTSKIGIGIIGAGGWAKLCHIPYLQSHPQAQVVALCARNRERCAALAEEFGVPGVYADYRELIASEDIQAVTIATPNVMHHPVALEALRAGKHVFCEKPPAMTAEHAQEMEREAARSGKHHQVAFLFRYLYGIRQAQEMLQEGAIGKVFYVRVEGGSASEIVPGTFFGWRHDRDQAGTGILGDVGSHYLDIIRMVAGEIVSVCGQTVTLPRRLTDASTGKEYPVTTDDIASVLLEIEGGIRGQLFTGRACPQRRYAEIELFGEQGGIRCTLSRGEMDRVEMALHGEPYEMVPLPEGQTEQPGRCMEVMMHRFIDHILDPAGKDDRDADFTDGRKAQEITDAVVRSIAEKRWVGIGEGLQGVKRSPNIIRTFA